MDLATENMEAIIEKPTIEVVLAYAKKSVAHFTYQRARHLPDELKEEIEQDAFKRVWESYQDLDPARGWKTFIQRHCFGAVMDYIKGGHGSAESELGMNQLHIIDKDDGDTMSVEDTVAVFGVFQTSFLEQYRPKQKWDLINRMIYKDENLHIVAKVLCGYSQEQISEQIALAEHPDGTDISRERVSQRIREFFDNLDDFCHKDPWVDQCIYALGLSEYYYLEECDNDLGWNFPAFFDANTETSFKEIQRYKSPSLLDYARSQAQ